jgi:hypothetical protein
LVICVVKTCTCCQWLSFERVDMQRAHQHAHRSGSSSASHAPTQDMPEAYEPSEGSDGHGLAGEDSEEAVEDDDRFISATDRGAHELRDAQGLKKMIRTLKYLGDHKEGGKGKGKGSGKNKGEGSRKVKAPRYHPYHPRPPQC